MERPPAHYWIMVVDIEDYSSRPDALQSSLRTAMHTVLRNAVADAHLDWDSLGTKDEGDGMILFLPAALSPVRVVGGLVKALDAALAEAEHIYSDKHRLRFRVALHQGLATADDTGWAGDAVNTACRLVDAKLLRQVLQQASRARLALIVSHDFHRAVIRPGHRSIDPATFLPVTVDLKKAPNTRAWVHVPGYPSPPGLTAGSAAGREPLPRPSRDAPGDDGPDAPEATIVPPSPSPRGPVVHGGISVGKVMGDQVVGDKYVTHHYKGGDPDGRA